MARNNDNNTSQPVNADILHWFSGIQVWRLEEDFYLVRDFTPAHLTCTKFRTPLTISVFCTGGFLQGEIDGKPFTLRSNEALLTLPGQTVCLHYLSQDLRCTLCAMSRNMAEEQHVGEEYTLYDNILKNPVLTFGEEQMRAIITMTELYAYTVQQRQHPRQREILLTLLKVNHNLHAMSLHDTESVPDTAMERTGSIAMRFNRLLEANYTRQHHVAFYAGKLALTSKYLSTVVKQASGHSAGWWIDHCLMRDAERYLTETQLPVQAIADLLGFPDQSSFGKYFRRRQGVSPAHYRTIQALKNHIDNETTN